MVPRTGPGAESGGELPERLSRHVRVNGRPEPLTRPEPTAIPLGTLLATLGAVAALVTGSWGWLAVAVIAMLTLACVEFKQGRS